MQATGLAFIWSGFLKETFPKISVLAKHANVLLKNDCLKTRFCRVFWWCAGFIFVLKGWSSELKYFFQALEFNLAKDSKS